MTANTIVVDANVLIDASKRRGSAETWLSGTLATDMRLVISAVTVAEFLSGIDPVHESDARSFIAPFEVAPVTLEVGILAGHLRYKSARRGRAIALADALIAATAVFHNASLVTSNVRDFWIDGLTVRPPGRLE